MLIKGRNTKSQKVNKPKFNLKIEKYGQYFKVIPYPQEEFGMFLLMLTGFNRNLTTIKMDIEYTDKNRPKKVFRSDKEFYVIEYSKCNKEGLNLVRYPLTLLNRFINYIDSYLGYEFDLVEKEVPEGRDIDIVINPKYKLRDYQERAVTAIHDFDSNNLLLDMPTGTGKTLTAVYSIVKLKKAFGVLVLPRYIDKWINDIKELTNVTEDEILVIRGITTFVKILNSKPEDYSKYKVFIISLKSLSLFIDNYLEGLYKDVLVNPVDDLTKILGMSYLLNDEMHQEFHNVYRGMLFLNVKLLLGMTATLVTKDKRLSEIYKLFLPDNHRITNIIKFKNYIRFFAIEYYFKNPKRIKYKNQFGYNQNIFEKSILKKKRTLEKYLEMIYRISLDNFYNYRKEKDPYGKLLIFAGKIEMCEKIRDYLKNKPEYKDMVINKYTQEDDYENLMESDIIISTILSSGTAVDIPNLMSVIQTVVVQSLQANEQTKGRLRFRGEDKEHIFSYIYCAQIPVHRKTHKERLKIFLPISKEFKSYTYMNEI